MAQPVLHAAHAAVSADVDLQSRTPTHLVARAGKPLAVRFTYQVHDAPAVAETWRFRLSVRLDEGPERVEEARFDDQSSVDEDAQALVVEVVPGRGEHTLHFTAEADLVAASADGTTRRVRTVARRLGGSVLVSTA